LGRRKGRLDHPPSFLCPCFCSLVYQNGKAGPRQPVKCVVESNETKHIQWSYTLQLAYCHKTIISKFVVVLSVKVVPVTGKLKAGFIATAH
jgi:hypothetical protein